MTRDEYKAILLARRGQLSKQTPKIKTLGDAALKNSALTAEVLKLPAINNQLIAFWLVGTTINASRFGKFDDLLNCELHFLEAWGTISPHRSGGSASINESRFLRWLKLSTENSAIEEFYSETQKMLDVFKSYNTNFNISSLADIAVRIKHDDFKTWAMNLFLNGQKH